jgi:hypothetical protein
MLFFVLVTEAPELTLYFHLALFSLQLVSPSKHGRSDCGLVDGV